MPYLKDIEFLALYGIHLKNVFTVKIPRISSTTDLGYKRMLIKNKWLNCLVMMIDFYKRTTLELRLSKSV